MGAVGVSDPPEYYRYFFHPEFIKKHLGETRFGSIVKAALIGIPMPLCISGVIPMTLSLRRNGASKGAASSFLISTPQTGGRQYYCHLVYAGLGSGEF